MTTEEKLADALATLQAIMISHRDYSFTLAKSCVERISG